MRPQTPKPDLVYLLLRYMLTVSFVLCFLGISDAKTMRAKDYFESGSQIILAEATTSGDTEKIDRLLADGVDVNARGRSGMTAVLWALVNQNRKTFTYLLEHGANPNLQLAEDGNSAMSLAAMHEDIYYLEMVIKHGGNPNLINPMNKRTPIFGSIGALRPKHVRLLIASGADLNLKDGDGGTPLLFAASGNQYEMVYAMLDAGADPQIKNDWGRSPLVEFKRGRLDPNSDGYNWRLKVLSLLKAKGIDIENRN